MILHGEPFKAPPLDAIIQRNVEILSLPTLTKFKASAANHLMMPPAILGLQWYKYLHNPKCGLIWR
jgi:hypothetical protein